MRERLNLFSRTRYALAEEDRIVNGLLVLLESEEHRLLAPFLTMIGAPVSQTSSIQVREHVPYGRGCVVDAEIRVDDQLLVIVEAKVQPNQFDDSDQVARYVELIRRDFAKSRCLLLLSPDDRAPKVVGTLSAQVPDLTIAWLAWEAVGQFLELTALRARGSASSPTTYLIDHFLEYMQILGLRAEASEAGLRTIPRLHFLFGNVATEKILLHLYHHGGGYANGIARDHRLGMGATQRVLQRLVRAGLVIQERRARMVWFRFDPDHPLLDPLLGVVRLAYDAMTPDERRKAFEPTYTTSARMR